MLHKKLFKLFSFIVVYIAWFIPGKPHRWSVKLIAERNAMLRLMEKLRSS